MLPPEQEQLDQVPMWAAFGDLMACLFGLFVLFFVWLVSFQLSLTSDLESERAQKEAATARVAELERALAGPIDSGMITLVDGRIGIRGSVLFARNSALLTPRGRGLLSELAVPLKAYLEGRDEALMISGFTDDLRLHGNMRPFEDNWELSAQRALTVTRELIQAGVPDRRMFAAGFGHNHPVAPNDSEPNRARNRRVEITPVPSPQTITSRVRLGNTRMAAAGN